MVFERIKNTIQHLTQLGVLYTALMGVPSVLSAQEAGSDTEKEPISTEAPADKKEDGSSILSDIKGMVKRAKEESEEDNSPKNKEASFGFNYDQNSTSGSASVSKFSENGLSGTLGVTETIRARRLLEMSGNRTNQETITGNGVGFWRGDLSDSLRATAMLGGNWGKTYEGFGSDTKGWKSGTTLSNNLFNGSFVYRVNGINNDNRDSTTTTTDWKVGFNPSFGGLRTGLTYGQIDNDTNQTIHVGSRTRNASHSQDTDYWTLTASHGGTSFLYSRRNVERSLGEDSLSHRARVGFDLAEGARLYFGHSQSGSSKEWNGRIRFSGDNNLVTKMERVESTESRDASEEADEHDLGQLTKRVNYADFFASVGTDNKYDYQNIRLGLQFGAQSLTQKGSNGINASLTYDRSKQAGRSTNNWGLSVEKAKKGSSYFGTLNFENDLDRVGIGLGLRWTY